jgi:hypothetical protein
VTPLAHTRAEPAASNVEAPGSLKPWQFFLLAGMLAATASVLVAAGQPAASIVTLSFTTVAAGLAGLGLYRTLLPLVSADARETPPLVGGRTRAALEREKTLVLRSIKELEFDFAMGKVAQADFDEMSGRLRARAVRLLQQLDSRGGYRAEIERELQVRLGARGSMPGATGAPAVVPEAVETAATVPACGTCGGGNDTDARFCKHCGTRLPGAA